MGSGYGFGTILNTPYEEGIAHVKEALKVEGFDVLTEIDARQTLREKLRVEMEPHLILGGLQPGPGAPSTCAGAGDQAAVALQRRGTYYRHWLPCRDSRSTSNDGHCRQCPARRHRPGGERTLATSSSCPGKAGGCRAHMTADCPILHLLLLRSRSLTPDLQLTSGRAAHLLLQRGFLL